MQLISAQQIAAMMDWNGVLETMRQAHLGPRPIGESFFIGDEHYALFSWGVVLPGLGAGLQVCSIHPDNGLATPPRPVEQAAFLVIDEQSKAIVVILDVPQITRWKSATNSALAAHRRLKQTLSLDNFSGRSVTAVKQDFHAGQLLKNLALLMHHLLQPVIEQRHKARKLRWKVNFTQGLSRLKNTLVELLAHPCVQGLAHLLGLMANSLSAVRPGRSFPRQRKRLASRGCEGYKPTR